MSVHKLNYSVTVVNLRLSGRPCRSRRTYRNVYLCAPLSKSIGIQVVCVIPCFFSLVKMLSVPIRSDSLVNTLMLYSINTGELHCCGFGFSSEYLYLLQVYSHRKKTSCSNTCLIMSCRLCAMACCITVRLLTEV